MHIERARFRRARGEPADAMLALPLHLRERHDLKTAAAVAGVMKLPTGRSELASDWDPDDEGLGPPRAWLLAEAGDILYSAGELRRGREVLLEAVELDSSVALETLARWELSLGESRANDATMEWIGHGAKHHNRALELIDWMIDAGRLHAARSLRDRIECPPLAPARELATRLRLLGAQANAPR